MRSSAVRDGRSGNVVFSIHSVHAQYIHVYSSSVSRFSFLLPHHGWFYIRGGCGAYILQLLAVQAKHFYPAIWIVILSVRPSVRPSVHPYITFGYCIETARIIESSNTFFSTRYISVILVLPTLNIFAKFRGR